VTPGQEARLLELPAPARVTTISDADLLFLLPASRVENRNAVIVVNYVKMLAAGRRRKIVRDRTVWEALGWSESMYRRAKRAAIEAGIPIRHRSYRGENAPSEWLLDRRLIAALRCQERHHVVSGGTPPYIGKNALGVDLPSVDLLPKAARDGPWPPEPEGEGVTAPIAGGVSDVEEVATPPGGPPAELSWPVAELEQWLDERFELGSEEGRARAVAAIPEAVSWLRSRMSVRGEVPIVASVAGHWLAQSLRSLDEVTDDAV
jgi:hypothetical protein